MLAYMKILFKEPKITLVLDIDEFAILESFRYNTLGAQTDLSSSIDLGFRHIISKLDYPWDDLVVKARVLRGNTEQIKASFDREKEKNA